MYYNVSRGDIFICLYLYRAFSYKLSFPWFRQLEREKSCRREMEAEEEKWGRKRWVVGGVKRSWWILAETSGMIDVLIGVSPQL